MKSSFSRKWKLTHQLTRPFYLEDGKRVLHNMREILYYLVFIFPPHRINYKSKYNIGTLYVSDFEKEEKEKRSAKKCDNGLIFWTDWCNFTLWIIRRYLPLSYYFKYDNNPKEEGPPTSLFRVHIVMRLNNLHRQSNKPWDGYSIKSRLKT